MLSDLLWVVALAVAIGLAIGASKLHVSPWWILAPGAVAVALLAVNYSAATDCDSGPTWAFLISGLVALVSFVLTPLTALVDVIRHGGRARLLPLIPTLLLAVAAFFLVGSAFGSCLE